MLKAVGYGKTVEEMEAFRATDQGCAGVPLHTQKVNLGLSNLSVMSVFRGGLR